MSMDALGMLKTSGDVVAAKSVRERISYVEREFAKTTDLV